MLYTGSALSYAGMPCYIPSTVLDHTPCLSTATGLCSPTLHALSGGPGPLAWPVDSDHTLFGSRDYTRQSMTKPSLAPRTPSAPFYSIYSLCPVIRTLPPLFLFPPLASLILIAYSPFAVLPAFGTFSGRVPYYQPLPVAFGYKLSM